MTRSVIDKPRYQTKLRDQTLSTRPAPAASRVEGGDRSVRILRRSLEGQSAPYRGRSWPPVDPTRPVPDGLRGVCTPHRLDRFGTGHGGPHAGRPTTSPGTQRPRRAEADGGGRLTRPGGTAAAGRFAASKARPPPLDRPSALPRRGAGCLPVESARTGWTWGDSASTTSVRRGRRGPFRPDGRSACARPSSRGRRRCTRRCGLRVHREAGPFTTGPCRRASHAGSPQGGPTGGDRCRTVAPSTPTGRVRANRKPPAFS